MKDITEEPQTVLQFIKSPEFWKNVIIGLVVIFVGFVCKIIWERRKLRKVNPDFTKWLEYANKLLDACKPIKAKQKFEYMAGVFGTDFRGRHEVEQADTAQAFVGFAETLLYYVVRDFEEAKKKAFKAIKNKGPKGDSYLILGMASSFDNRALSVGRKLYSAQELMEKAVISYSWCLRTRNHRLWKRINNCLEEGDFDTVINTFTAVLESPCYRKSADKRSSAYAGKGGYDSDAPARFEVLYHRGNAYLEKGDYGKTTANYTAALDLKPELYDILRERGVSGITTVLSTTRS